MPVTDQRTSAAMAQAKSRLSRYLLLCFVAMLVIGMSFAGVASAQTTDSLEPNDTIDEATDVGSGAEYDDVSIDSSSDVDYYAVDVEEGEIITANIEFSDAEGDIDLDIEDSDGLYLTGSYSVTDDETASYVAEESGTYYVRVYGYSGATADYDINISTETGDRLEPNNDLESATDLGSGGSYDDLEVSSYGDSDYFAVEADAGDTITADIFFDDDNGDIDLELQDSDGYYLDGAISVTDDESISYTVDESGTYYVEVYPWSGAPNSYDIDVSTDGSGTDTGGDSDGDRLEPNDDLASATDLGSGGSYDDLEVSSYSDSDYFAVEADAGDTITADIFFEDDNGDIDLELQDSDGYYLDGSISVTDDESVSYTVSESGTYYVEVYPWSGAPNSYDIDVTTNGSGTVSGDSLEPNDDLESATELGSGGSYDDLEVSSYGDSDYFAVEADAGDTITADIFFSDAEGDVDMTLEDSNGYYLDGSASVTDDESISYTVDESGTYYIEVYPFSGPPTSYDIDVSTDGSGSDDGGDDQIEDGADLRSISIGETAEGTIDTLDPTVEGYYHEPVSLYGEAGTTVDISMESETGDTYLVLQGPDGEYLTYDDDGGDSLNSEIADYELPQTGSYTIIATSYSGESTFDYTLSVSSDGTNAEEPAQTNDDLSLDANATATAGGDMLVEFDLENTGSEDQAVILQAGDGVDQLGDGYSISDRSDDGGNWRSSESSWLFDSLSGEVNPSVTIDVPEEAQGEQTMTVVAESDEGNVSTTVVLDLDDIGIVQAADTNDDGELSDSEILAAIEAWRTDSTIEGTDVTVSDEEIINLISTWRAEGS